MRIRAYSLFMGVSLACGVPTAMAQERAYDVGMPAPEARSNAANQRLITGEKFVGPGALDRRVAVEDLRIGDTTISGRLANQSDDTVSDVRVLVQDTFLWANEFHPGTDNPSRVEVHTVKGDIPPHGTVPFQFSREPLPERRDGRFDTSVEVTGLTSFSADAPASRGLDTAP